MRLFTFKRKPRLAKYVFKRPGRAAIVMWCMTMAEAYMAIQQARGA
jgi:hypothetical protein